MVCGNYRSKVHRHAKLCASLLDHRIRLFCDDRLPQASDLEPPVYENGGRWDAMCSAGYPRLDLKSLSAKLYFRTPPVGSPRRKGNCV